MKKLFLSSTLYPTTKYLKRFIDEGSGSLRLALISNAKDHYKESIKKKKTRNYYDHFSELGFDVEVLDLLETKSSRDLKNKLQKFDVVWVMSGNTFHLRSAMHQSGFDTIIHKLVSGGLVYAGDSAGAVVAGESLKGFEDSDSLDTVENVIYDGLELTHHIILPHSDNSDYSRAINKVKSLYEAKGSLIELKDSEFITIEDNKLTIT